MQHGCQGVKKDVAWCYFHISSCSLYNTAVPHSSNTNNVYKHLKTKHPATFKEGTDFLLRGKKYHKLMVLYQKENWQYRPSLLISNNFLKTSHSNKLECIHIALIWASTLTEKQAVEVNEWPIHALCLYALIWDLYWVWMCVAWFKLDKKSYNSNALPSLGMTKTQVPDFELHFLNKTACSVK